MKLLTKKRDMSDYLPLGAEFESHAPWNEQDEPEMYSICRKCGAYIVTDCFGNQQHIEDDTELEHSGTFVDKCVQCYLDEL